MSETLCRIAPIKKKKMKKNSSISKIFLFVVFVFVILFSNHLQADKNPSLKERKKIFEQKLKLLSEISSVFPEAEFVQKIDVLEKSSDELNEIFKRGNENEKRNTILKSELTLSEIQKVYVKTLSEISQELIRKIAMSKSAEKFHKEDVKMTRDLLEKKEKSGRYFSMAKEEFNSAEKFSRDGNLSYALHIYKRSIKYSLSAIKVLSSDVEKKYETAVEKWVLAKSKLVVN